MAEPNPSRLWAMRIWFVVLAMTILFLHLLPLDTMPRRWAPPDFLIAFAYAWALRRPEFVPPLLLAAVMLLADLLLQRPPGLMAALVVVGGEYLKNRFLSLRDASFVGEWVAVGIVLVAITVVNRLVLFLLAVNQAQLGLVVFQLLATMLAYPVVAAITQSLMGVRKLGPSDADTTGARA